MDVKKSVCVIGAGAAGLCSTKCMLDAGFDVYCFEINKHVGGRWHRGNKNPIPRSTLTNLPKHMSCFSDFPMPDDFPLYMSADIFSHYFELYTEHFNLNSKIKFEHEVVNAEPHSSAGGDAKEDTENTDIQNHHLSRKQPQWKVTIKNILNGTIYDQIFDNLVVCNGFYSIPYTPQHIKELLNGFDGKIIHSVNYVDSKEFEGQNVLLSGLGNTGGDLSVEVSKCARRTVLSTSHGTDVMGRLGTNGVIPIEAATLRVRQFLPSFISRYAKTSYLRQTSNHNGDFSKLGLIPSDVSGAIVNDELIMKITSGRIMVKPSITKIEGRKIYFSNGTAFENVDTTILCTGYVREFPFFNKTMVPLECNGKRIPLYKRIFLPKYASNLAFIGMSTIFGPLAITFEMQTRYAAEVFRGTIKLPDEVTMEKDVQESIDKLDAEHPLGLKEYNVINNVYGYLDELADGIGCRISLTSLLWKDPMLFWHLYKNYIAFEYRLNGPNHWKGARDAILNNEHSKYGFLVGSRNHVTN